jgi:hypothetical protein
MIPAIPQMRVSVTSNSYEKSDCVVHLARKAREKLSGTDNVGLEGEVGDVLSIGGSTCFGKTQTLALPSESMEVK